ncbi:Ku protein [Rhizobium leguminosarum]|uniref:non-homologous end joining protein Ku n=1 Tax=Rhizobium leguminosarum TaxID=384 RepID=UPI001C97FF67|nr:Ku protein [Rhizobium leguminosarum]MBY5645885.1 Ku protein [Rhizobium leguminosarum]
MASGHRAQWKGFLNVGEVSCGVALYTAASTSERITFNTVNKATGNRVNRIFIDGATEEPVSKEDQTKGFEVGDGRYIIIDPDEIAATIPQSNKTLEIEAFVPCSEIDDVYFDKPYYLTPSDRVGSDAFTLLRDGMKNARVAAIARTVLFRRMRSVLIRPHDNGMIATTLQYDYEVRSTKSAFEGIPKLKIEGEMLDLAKHIISTKIGTFDPATFDDRYEQAVAELVKAKLEGKAPPKPKKVQVSKPNDLLSALRESAGLAGNATEQPKRTAANANKGTQRQRASRGAAKSAASAGAQRRAG